MSHSVTKSTGLLTKAYLDHRIKCEVAAFLVKQTSYHCIMIDTCITDNFVLEASTCRYSFSTSSTQRCPPTSPSSLHSQTLTFLLQLRLITLYHHPVLSTHLPLLGTILLNASPPLPLPLHPLPPLPPLPLQHRFDNPQAHTNTPHTPPHVDIQENSLLNINDK